MSSDKSSDYGSLGLTKVEMLIIGEVPGDEDTPFGQSFLSSEPDMTPAQWRRLGEHIVKVVDEGYQQINMDEVVSNNASEDKPG